MCGFAVQRLSFQPCPARAAEGGGPYDVTNQNRTYGGDLCPAAAAPQRNPAAHRWPPYIGCGADSPECSVWIGGVLRGSSRTPTLTKERAIPVFAAKRFFPSGSDILHGPPRRLRRRRQLPRCISDRSMSASAGAGTAARR